MLKPAALSTALLFLVVTPAFAASVAPSAKQLSALRNAGWNIVLPGRLPAGFKADELTVTVSGPGFMGDSSLMTYTGPNDEGFGIESVKDGIGSMDFQSAPKFTVNLRALGAKYPTPAYLAPVNEGQKPSWISEWIVTPKSICRLLGCGQIATMHHRMAANNEISPTNAKLVLESLKAY